MNAAEGLGISPIPWSVYDGERGNDGYYASVHDSDGLAVHYSDDTYTSAPYLEANARLFAASPELYACLCDAVTDFCKDCTHETNCHDFFIPCPARKLRSALAKAGGEEDE